LRAVKQFEMLQHPACRLIYVIQGCIYVFHKLHDLGWYTRIEGTLHTCTLTLSGVWLVTGPHRAAMRRIREISAVINIWMNRDLGEGVLQKEVLCSMVESVDVVDLRKSRCQKMQVKLTTHVRIVPRLRMRGAVPPLMIRFRNLALIMQKDHLDILW
jgi:hypothetical protein